MLRSKRKQIHTLLCFIFLSVMDQSSLLGGRFCFVSMT